MSKAEVLFKVKQIENLEREICELVGHTYKHMHFELYDDVVAWWTDTGDNTLSYEYEDEDGEIDSYGFEIYGQIKQYNGLSLVMEDCDSVLIFNNNKRHSEAED